MLHCPDGAEPAVIPSNPSQIGPPVAQAAGFGFPVGGCVVAGGSVTGVVGAGSVGWLPLPPQLEPFSLTSLGAGEDGPFATNPRLTCAPLAMVREWDGAVAVTVVPLEVKSPFQPLA